MHFIFLTPCHNEEASVLVFFSKMQQFRKNHPNTTVVIINNGSTDQTLDVIIDYQKKNKHWIEVINTEQKGLGLAFSLGIEHIRNLSFENDTWVVFNAIDLPFDFTDLNFFMTNKPRSLFCIGSKYHVHSKVKRSFIRHLASYFFYFLRLILLGIKIKDTQGSFIIDVNLLKKVKPIQMKNHLYAVEIVAQFKNSTKIIEIPIELKKDFRPSRFSPISEMIPTIKGLIQIRKSLKND